MLESALKMIEHTDSNITIRKGREARYAIGDQHSWAVQRSHGLVTVAFVRNGDDWMATQTGYLFLSEP